MVAQLVGTGGPQFSVNSTAYLYQDFPTIDEHFDVEAGIAGSEVEIYPGDPISPEYDPPSIDTAMFDGLAGLADGGVSYEIDYNVPPAYTVGTAGIYSGPATISGGVTGYACVDDPVLEDPCGEKGAELWSMDLSGTGTGSITWDPGGFGLEDEEVDIETGTAVVTYIAAEPSALVLTLIALLLPVLLLPRRKLALAAGNRGAIGCWPLRRAKSVRSATTGDLGYPNQKPHSPNCDIKLRCTESTALSVFRDFCGPKARHEMKACATAPVATGYAILENDHLCRRTSVVESSAGCVLPEGYILETWWGHSKTGSNFKISTSAIISWRTGTC
ncbi:MAG: hypothetical protein ACRD2B_17360 [Terriglobia bacterium]